MADDIRLVIGVDDRDLIRTQKEQKKFERNLLIIESAFRKGDITAKRYTAELNKQAKQLSLLGGTYNKANSEVRTYAAAIRKLTDDQLDMAQATNAAGKSTNRFGMYAQQVGYQVGDFFVQVQSGTSALVAFGQQGTQLAGLLPGLSGAIIGIGLSVGTMLLRTFSQAKEAANGTSASIKAFEESLKSAKEETASMSQELLVLEGGFTGVSEAALDAAVKKAKEAVAEAQAEFNRESNFLLKGFDLSDPDDMEDYLDLMQDYTDALQDAMDAQKAAEKDYLDFRLNQQALANEKGKAYLSEMVDFFRQAYLEIKQMDQQSIDERSNAIADGIEIFRAAQKRMREEETAETERSLDRLFKNRTLFYSIRFQDEATVMDQSVTPSSKKIGMSYAELLAAGVPHENIIAMGIKPPRATKAKESDLSKLQKQLELEDALLGKTEARQRVIQALGVKFVEDNPKTVAGLEAQITANENLLRIEEERKRMNDLVTDSMENGLMAMADGTKSVSDAFRDMAREIIAELYRILVVQQMVNAAKSFMGFGLFENGGAFSGGSQIQAYADGGVVGSPTYFGMSGGKTGLMGEAGPEAILPLKRGANGKLGVQMEGNGGGVTINQNINISTGVQQTVRTEIKSLMPQIAEQSKAAVLDAKRRGGSYGSKF